MRVDGELRCKTHPRYRAGRQPQGPCPACVLVYLLQRNGNAPLFKLEPWTKGRILYIRRSR